MPILLCSWKHSYILLFPCLCLQEMHLLEDFFHNWFWRSPLKNVWELAIMQQRLLSKGLAAHTQRGLIFIKWFLLVLLPLRSFDCWETFCCILIVAVLLLLDLRGFSGRKQIIELLYFSPIRAFHLFAEFFFFFFILSILNHVIGLRLMSNLPIWVSFRRWLIKLIDLIVFLKILL